MSERSNSFQTRTLPWLVVAGLAIVGAVMWFNRPGSRSPEPVGAAEPTAEQAHRPQRSAVDTRIEARAAMARAAIASKTRRAEMRARVDRAHKLLGQRYASERIDPAWSASKEQELVSLAKTDAMTAMGANVSNLTIDCRTTTCSIDGDFPNMTAGDDWFTLYMTNVGAKLPNASYKYEHKPDGTVRMHIFAIGRR